MVNWIKFQMQNLVRCDQIESKVQKQQKCHWKINVVLFNVSVRVNPTSILSHSHFQGSLKISLIMIFRKKFLTKSLLQGPHGDPKRRLLRR